MAKAHKNSVQTGKVQTPQKYKDVHFQVKRFLTSMWKRVQRLCALDKTSKFKGICFPFRRKVVPVTVQDTISLVWDSSTVQDQQEGI